MSKKANNPFVVLISDSGVQICYRSPLSPFMLLAWEHLTPEQEESVWRGDTDFAFQNKYRRYLSTNG